MMKRVGKAVLRRVKKILVALDQLANVVFLFGDEDETVSARCWRLRRLFWWGLGRRLLDGVALLFLDRDHCEKSYQSEMRRLQSPPEYRLNIAEKDG